jgi:hydroxymethylbilane synthase
MKPLRIATRRSQLAQWQARWVADRFQALGYPTELVFLTSDGDNDQRPIQSQSGFVMGLFTRRIQEAVLNHEADLAVHSLKDLPTATTPGLSLVAVPERASVHDCLITKDGIGLNQLGLQARMGTGSRRRAAQLLHLRPDVRCEPIRGNVETRLDKVLSGEFDATVLAAAGLDRLKLAQAHRHTLTLEQMLPAPGQGALGIEVRDHDPSLLSAAQRLNDPWTWASVLAERRMLAVLQGGCLAPIAAYGHCEGDLLRLRGVVLSACGQHRLYAEGSGERSRPEQLGEQVAQKLLKQGADQLIANC